MMVSGMSNVVILPRGAHGAMPKDSGSKSDKDMPMRGTSEADVTVLFPRAKASAHVWSKAQKSAAEAGPDAKKEDDESDSPQGQDVFGSLVASVQQKLTQQDEQPASENVTAPSVVSARASVLPPSQLMGRGKLVDALQNFKEKPLTDSSKSDVFSNTVDDISPDRTIGPVPAAILPVGKSRIVFGSENVPAFEPSVPEKSIPSKSVTVSVQATMIAPDETDPQPSTPLPDPAASSPPEKGADISGPLKVMSEPKKEPSVPKGLQAEAPNSHVVQISHPAMSETKLSSPAAQIVENIRNAVPPAAIAPRSATGIPMPVKTLEVQLQPEGLGAITVSLKTEQGKLKVEISAKLESTRRELERDSTELVSGLQRVDPSFKAADVNFSDQRQDASPENMGQTPGNGGQNRSSPENMSGFGSNGGRDANQPSGNSQPKGYGVSKSEQKRVDSELPSRLDRADGIYL